MTDKKEDIDVPPFQEYKFEEDEGWQILQKNLEFPGNIDEKKKEKILLKKKKKYYKSIGGTLIDDSSSSLPSYNKNDNNTNNYSTDNSTNNPTDDNIKQSKSNNNEYKYKSNNNKSKKKEFKKKIVKKPPFIQQLLNFFYLFSNWSCLLFGIVSVVIRPLFRYSLIICAVMHLVCLIQTHGRPKFNMYFAQQIMQDPNTMILIYSLMFLMGPPIVIFLGPLLFRSFYMGCWLLNGVLELYLSNNLLSLKSKLKTIIKQQGWYLTNIALFEVIIGIILIPCILFVKRTFLLTIIYWQIMQAKYMMDGNIKHAFTKVNYKILGYTSKVPMIHNIYLKITYFLSDMVDPQKLRQRYEQQQSGTAPTGMVGNMMKKCVIM